MTTDKAMEIGKIWRLARTRRILLTLQIRIVKGFLREAMRKKYYHLEKNNVHGKPRTLLPCGWDRFITFLAISQSSVFAFGLNAMQVVAAILIAACIVSAGYVFNGRAAVKYGIPFAMQIRDTFGIKGAAFPAMIRGLVAGFVFFGLTTIASAQALDIVLARLFPGFLVIGEAPL